ncbi:hypothetical protein BDP81DRAFT_417937 [Colletotrichum phormii]|uniref:Uncharacterized protein n=1 Tax=Colletotrichum phormii TaxID=359342 RepID=A0AAI9ZZE0_9PEZI|nr:uncharacterized protein BDP81DRAFT_417937 [Colletotrichum phormii]KAK1641045.1 hypothetical protein BDP81DRAFT_417937 [Colletotrichum phormii]
MRPRGLGQVSLMLDGIVVYMLWYRRSSCCTAPADIVILVKSYLWKRLPAVVAP